ncbi:PEGA domain-containing protein [Candidatus Uabimicrobium sp. HlEnr_7]|uniref:PEGA domain-containing protein n=1 Tax=Candidatus Uabimicrobium helgolandensis TaxID=3095367 RepID=UPI003555DE3D
MNTLFYLRCLHPKRVEMQINTYDVPPEKDRLYRVLLKNEIASGIPVKTGDRIFPESYVYDIIRPGYELVSQQMLIMPRETPYVIAHCLKARERDVNIKILDKNGNLIAPDTIRIDNRVIKQNFKIKPGNYKITVEKEGYKTLYKKIVILADDETFVIREELQK